MEEVDKCSRMSEKSPPMQPPLLKELEYNGITLFGDNLILGQAANLERIDKFTQ